MTLALLLATLAASAATTFGVDGIYYEVNNNDAQTVKVTSVDSSITSAVIPETVCHESTYTVTGVDIGVYGNRNSNLESLTIPSTVTYVRISKCDGLTNLYIPSSVTSIDISFCDGLMSLYIPSSVTSLKIFSCDGLTSLYIPSSVTNLDISHCDGLTSLDIPSSVITIYISYCDGLTSLSIPSSVTFLSVTGCSGLTSLDVPSSVTYLRVSSCSGLTNLDIPSSVTDLHVSGCSGLTSLDIPSSVTCLSVRGSGLTSLDIPSSVTSLGVSYCDGLTNLDIPSSVTILSVSYCDGLTTLDISDCSDLTDLTIFDCPGLTSLNIPSSVTYLTVRNCPALLAFDIGDDYTMTKINVTLAVCGITIGGQKPVISDKDAIDSMSEVGESCYMSYKTGVSDYNGGTYLYRTVIDYYFNGLYPYSSDWKSSIVIDNSSIVNNSTVDVDCAPFSYKAKWDSRYNEEIDPEITDYGFVFDTDQRLEADETFSVEGSVVPGSTHSIYFYGRYGRYESWTSETVTFTAPQLSWGTGEATATSTTSARLMCETNLPDGTVGGFEWKRNEAPEGMPATKAPCPVVDGRLTGSLRNLKDDVYYKCRPYYIAEDEKEYYGEWFYAFTGDAGVYFEPEVTTFTPAVLPDDDGGCTVTMSGYALPGSDDILTQGFEYQPVSGGSSSQARAASGWTEVAASSGIIMDATVTDLAPATEYVCRAFATTVKGRFTGSEQRFTTPGNAGIHDTVADEAEAPEIIGYYNLQGIRLSAPARGINIVVYSDGTTRKVVVK